MRLVGEFQHVRQHDQIHTLGRNRQRIAHGAHFGARAISGAELELHAAGAQKIMFSHAVLQRIEAEYIRHDCIEIRLLVLRHVGA